MSKKPSQIRKYAFFNIWKSDDQKNFWNKWKDS